MEKDERDVQRSFWKDHSAQATQEEMMLDTCASEIDALDRPEVLAALGSLKHCTVLELGAGIGRFTGELADHADHVTACDFMEHLVEENRKAHSERTNIDYRAVDVAQMDCPAGSVDVIFSNWLLMYLSDGEVETFLKKALGWLKEGGILFFRESCYRQSGNVVRTFNPTHYRDVASYFALLDGAHVKEDDGRYFKYKLINCANLRSYIQLKRNFGQIYWKLMKVEKDASAVEPRQLLDHVQYTRRGILRYEKIFGHSFVSTGGIDTSNLLLDKLHLDPGSHVLDVGCGIGGNAFHVARRFRSNVLGIDLSVNMIAIALERAGMGEYDDAGSVLSFELADCTTRQFPSETFDAIYSRDAILHIHNKPKLFASFLAWLKPGGEILISDYCRAGGEVSDAFKAYIKQRNYDLHSVDRYGRMLRDAGFEDVTADDWTASMFVPSLEKEVQAIEETKEGFLESFTEEEHASLIEGWHAKIERAKAGEQRWGIFYAKKPKL